MAVHRQPGDGASTQKKVWLLSSGIRGIEQDLRTAGWAENGPAKVSGYFVSRAYKVGSAQGRVQRTSHWVFLQVQVLRKGKRFAKFGKFTKLILISVKLTLFLQRSKRSFCLKFEILDCIFKLLLAKVSSSDNGFANINFFQDKEVMRQKLCCK